MHRSSVRSSVQQHLLLSYNKSFAAVLRGQHEGKGIRCGAGTGLVGGSCPRLQPNPAVLVH